MLRHTPRRLSLTFRLTAGLALIACTILAGCAGIGRSTAPGSEFDLEASEWAAGANDPIGRLIVQQLKGNRGTHPLVREALKNIGIRYRFGGASPEAGFDCSGLVAYSAEKALKIKLPRSSAEISARGSFVEKDALKAGDLVFFNTLGQPYSHVGIYLGKNRFVHSPSSGGKVRVEDMNRAFWRQRYNGARRLDYQLDAATYAAN